MTNTDTVWAAYERLSPRPDGNYDPGMLRQREDCDAIAARHGGQVSEHLRFKDKDASAYSKKPRPEFQRLITAIRSGEVKRFAVQHPDRLYRKPKELEDLIELASSQGVVFATPGKMYDLTNTDDRFAARILVAVAAKSSDDTARRITRMHEGKAARGEPVGRRPFGYEADHVTPNPEEAAAFIAAVDDVLHHGKTNYAISRDWNAAGITTAYGNQWISTTVRQLLLNPRYAGLRTHRRKIIGAATWKGLIDTETYESLVTLLTDPRRLTNTVTDGNRVYLLSGALLRCGRPECGQILRGQRDGSRRGRNRTYHCSLEGGCGKLRIRADRLEHEVEEEVLVALRAMSTLGSERHRRVGRESTPKDSVPALEARLVALAEKLGSMDEAFSPEEYTALRRPLLQKLEKAKAAASPEALPVDTKWARSAVATWDVSTMDERHATIKRIVSDITIHPAKHRGQRDVLGRYTINWRDAPSAPDGDAPRHG